MESAADAQERLRLERMRARARRQPLILIMVFNVLIVAVGMTAVVDLRRLQTPGGTGLRWLQAAVFGDCDDYLTYSIPDPSRPDSRSHEQFCQDLLRSSAAARAESLKIGFVLGPVGADRVQVRLTRRGVTKTVLMHVVKRNGHWRVVRDALTCSSVGCA